MNADMFLNRTQFSIHRHHFANHRTQVIMASLIISEDLSGFKDIFVNIGVFFSLASFLRLLLGDIQCKIVQNYVIIKPKNLAEKWYYVNNYIWMVDLNFNTEILILRDYISL